MREASANTADVVQIVAAVLAAQQAAQQQPTPVAQQATQPFAARKWMTIGGLGIAGGLVASLFAVAVAIGAVSVAILALVLRGLWADFQKGR
ncbi:hypothetical protein [Streptomyces sp. NPDC001500]